MRADKLEQVDLVQGEDQKASTDVRHIAIPCHWSSMASTISDCLAVYGSSKARTIVFCETKKECNEMLVNPAIKVECQALHGDIPQVRVVTVVGQSACIGPNVFPASPSSKAHGISLLPSSSHHRITEST